jgi:hypothetical protein
MEYVSIGLSVLAAASSLYVWLVTANSERPRLRTHLVDEPQDRVNGNADLYYLSKFRKGVKLEGLFYYLYLKTVVMNDSSLPTTVVRIKCSIKSKDGTWTDATVAYAPEAEEEKAHPLGGSPSPLKPDWRDWCRRREDAAGQPAGDQTRRDPAGRACSCGCWSGPSPSQVPEAPD